MQRFVCIFVGWREGGRGGLGKQPPESMFDQEPQGLRVFQVASLHAFRVAQCWELGVVGYLGMFPLVLA